MTARGIPLLRDDQLVIAVSDPQFSPLVADSLGNELVDGDGWEEAITLAGLAFGEDSSVIDSLDQHLLDADFVEGALEAQAVTPVVAAAGGFVTSGDALFSDMADAIGNDPTQQPPSGGGGGGEGGGGVGSGGGGGTGGGGQNPPPLGPPGETRCHLVIARDGGSQYVCEVIPGGGGGAHGPLEE